LVLDGISGYLSIHVWGVEYMANPCLLIYSSKESNNPLIVYDPSSDKIYAYTELHLKSTGTGELPEGVDPDNIVAEIDLSKAIYLKDKSGLLSNSRIEEQIRALHLSPKVWNDVNNAREQLKDLIYSEEEAQFPAPDGLNRKFVICDAISGKTYTITGLAKAMPQRLAQRRKPAKVLGTICAHKAVCFFDKYGLVDSDALEQRMVWAKLSDKEIKNVRRAYSRHLAKQKVAMRPPNTLKANVDVKIGNG
jgi:hypothetical protein